MTNAPVLIVGSGPTGLNLALSLARRGVPFRLITEAEGPGAHSRAMVVQARTLEFYGQFGFADEVVRQGVKAGAAHLRELDGTDSDSAIKSRYHDRSLFIYYDAQDANGIGEHRKDRLLPEDEG